MKKFILPIVIFVLCASSVLTVLAAFQNPAVSDNAGLLTERRAAELESRLDQIRNAYQFDVAVYTEEEMAGLDAQNTTDDIFDDNGYGFGENRDGILLYISADPRSYHISTHGSGMTAFNENGLMYLEKQILPRLKEDNYDAAITAFADRAEELLEMAKKGEPFHKKQYSGTYLLCVIGGALLLPLLIAYLCMKRKLLKMKTAVRQEDAADYKKPGSFQMKYARDLFLYSTVTKTEKPKATGGSHTSSSGESHGGRGGSY